MTGGRTQTAQGAPPSASMTEVHVSLRPRQRSAERISQCRASPPHKGPSAGNGKLNLSAGSGKHCPVGDIHKKRDPPLSRSPPRTLSLHSEKATSNGGREDPGPSPGWVGGARRKKASLPRQTVQTANLHKRSGHHVHDAEMLADD